MDCRSGGLEFQPSPMMLDQHHHSTHLNHLNHLNHQNNYTHHLQRSIDTLRSLGDRLGERNVDLRLNLHGHHNGNGQNLGQQPQNQDYNNLGGGGRDGFDRYGLELNLSLSSQQQDRQNSLADPLGLDRLNLERSLSLDRSNDKLNDVDLKYHHRIGVDSSEHQGVGGVASNSESSRSGEPSQQQQQQQASSEQTQTTSTSGTSSAASRLRVGGEGAGGRNEQTGDGGDGDRATASSSPPTPISVVGDGFHEEKVFGSKAELQLHTQAHMREAKPYKCSQCCKAFANSSYLSQHTRIHLGIKPYRCEICQRKFTQLSHLQQHIRTHTGDKPYKCRHPGCQKAFSQLSNLQSHSRCHQTDKPYKCNSCYKCFSDEPSLLEHIPKHKESKHLKTHICQYCGKSYTQETYLSKHMQKHAERTDKRPPIGPGAGLMGLGGHHRGAMGLDHPYWPKVSPDSAAAAAAVVTETHLHDYPGDLPRQILEGATQPNDDLVIIRHHLNQQQQHQQQQHQPPPPPSTPNNNNNYDTSNQQQSSALSKASITTNSAFTPINSMMNHGVHHHHLMNHHAAQLAPNRPYLYDAINQFKQGTNSAASVEQQMQQQTNKSSSSAAAANGFPNQLISLHQIRNYAHQPNVAASTSSALQMAEHSILGGLKDK